MSAVARTLALAIAASLAGCAATGTAGDGSQAPATAPTPTPAPVRSEPPRLRLPPAALGRTLALQQHIAIRAPGHVQQLDVLLEADPEHVRLAVLAMGQVAARLDWDGARLDETRAPWWPPQVSGARILSDLQLSLWPVEAIASALPGGWRVVEEGAVRTLRHADEVVTTVTRRGADVVEIAQHRASYTLTITSQPLEVSARSEDGGASGAVR